MDTPTAHRKAMVPTIDISGFRRSEAAATNAILQSIERACRSHGFMVITGHGVSPAVIDKAYRSARRFYDLPQAVKAQYAAKGYRGYLALGGLAAAYSLDDRTSAPDYREMFVMSRELIDERDPYYASDAGRAVFAPNIWPKEVADFRSSWIAYYDEMEKLAHSLMQLFAITLGLPATWFEDKIDKHMSTMAVTDYPEQKDEPVPGQLRCGAHTDYGAITILRAEDKPGGLEVMNADGEWEIVPIVPDSFIINIGDLLQRWTNDEFKSSFHRVSNPPRGASGNTRRQSLIFFFHPNYDTVIEPLPGIKGEPRYPTTTTRAHLLSKINKMQDIPAGKAAPGPR